MTDGEALIHLRVPAATKARWVRESTRTHLFLATELAAKLEKMGRELKALRAAMHIDDRQGCLID